MTKLITAIQLFLFSCTAFAVEAAADPSTQFGGKWAGAIFMLLVLGALVGVFVRVMFYSKDDKPKE